MHQLLCRNTFLISSSLGGGQHGYLILCLDAAGYNNRKGLEFIMPYNLGEYPPPTKESRQRSSNSGKLTIKNKATSYSIIFRMCIRH